MTYIGNMMKQAQQLQQKMNDVEKKLQTLEVEGQAGAGIVKVIVPRSIPAYPLSPHELLSKFIPSV